MRSKLSPTMAARRDYLKKREKSQRLVYKAVLLARLVKLSRLSSKKNRGKTFNPVQHQLRAAKFLKLSLQPLRLSRRSLLSSEEMKTIAAVTSVAGRRRNRHSPVDAIASTFDRLLPSSRSSTLSPSGDADKEQSNATARAALEDLLKESIAWVPATELTTTTEKQLRPKVIARRKVKATESSKGPLKPQNSGVSKASKISKSYPRRCISKRTKGLRNIGNWCYRVSVMQSLVHLPVFLNWIERHNVSSGDKTIDSHYSCRRNPCLGCALKNFAGAYWADKQDFKEINAARIKLDEITNSLIKKRIIVTDVKSSNSQADAYDYLTFMLKTFDTASERNSGNKNQLKSKDGTAPPKSPISKDLERLFKITTVSSRQCPKCGHVESGVPVQDFSLGLSIATGVRKGLKTLPQYLEANLHEPVQVRCEGCRARPVTMLKRQNITHGPEALIVHFQRFYADWSRGRPAMRKLQQPVRFDELLDLSRFAAGKGVEGGLTYRLQSVVYHAGDLNFGHYVARVRGPDGRVALCDDSSVSFESGLGGLLKPIDGNFTPYILVYTKVDE